MKPMAFLLAAVAALSFCGLVPFAGADVAELCPVQILCISAREDGFLIRADGGVAASGSDLPAALASLGDAAPGRLLLATVDQIVVCGFSPDARLLLRCGLRPAVRIYLSPEEPDDPDALGRYLSTHSGSLTLGKLSDDGGAGEIPRLTKGESGLMLSDGKP